MNLTCHLLADEDLVLSTWHGLSEGEIVSRVSQVFVSLDMIASSLADYANASGLDIATIDTDCICV